VVVAVVEGMVTKMVMNEVVGWVQIDGEVGVREREVVCLYVAIEVEKRVVKADARRMNLKDILSGEAGLEGRWIV